MCSTVVPLGSGGGGVSASCCADLLSALAGSVLSVVSAALAALAALAAAGVLGVLLIGAAVPCPAPAVDSALWCSTRAGAASAEVGAAAAGVAPPQAAVTRRAERQRQAPPQGQQHEFHPTPTSRFLHPDFPLTMLRAACVPPE